MRSGSWEAQKAARWQQQPKAERWKYRRTWYVKAIERIARDVYYDPTALSDAQCKRIRKYWNRVNEFRRGESSGSYSLRSFECLEYDTSLFLLGTKPYFNLSRKCIGEAFKRKRSKPFRLDCGWCFPGARDFGYSWSNYYQTEERRQQAIADIRQHYSDVLKDRRFMCKVIN